MFADVPYEIRERYKVVFLLCQRARSMVTPFRQLASSKVVKQRRRRKLQHRMDYNADFIWIRNYDICQYL